MDDLVKAAVATVNKYVAAIPWDSKGMESLATKHGHTPSSLWTDDVEEQHAEGCVILRIEAETRSSLPSKLSNRLPTRPGVIFGLAQ